MLKNYKAAFAKASLVRRQRLCRRSARQAGLTMVELIVVVAIFAVISSVLFFNFSDFNTTVSLRNLSQEVALMVRKSQVYATGVHNLDGVSASSKVYQAYGISFSAKATGGAYEATTKRFVLFADTVTSGVNNRRYAASSSCGNPTTSNECVEAFGIVTGDKITSLCTDLGCSSTNTVNVVFRRPSPDAEICIDTGSGTCSSLRSFLKVVIQSARGQERNVTIWNTGQINVQ